MIKFARYALLIALVATTSVTNAQDEPKKKRKGNRQAAGATLMKKLEAAGLSEEQVAKFKDLAAAMQAETKALREKGMTMELTKKKRELMAKLQEANVKRKELQAKLTEEFGEETTKLFNEAAASNLKFRKAVYGMLTKEQIAKLPEQLQKQISAALKPAGNQKGKGKRKGKGKKKEAEAS